MGLFEYPRTVRLLTAGDFRHVFQQAVFRASHPCFLMLAVPNQQMSARLGLVVAKKNARKAVERNRLKRLIRESFRHRREQLPALDIVVLVRKDAVSSENLQIAVVLDKLWSRLTRLAKDSANQGEAS